jgi:hypothetical protein
VSRWALYEAIKRGDELPVRPLRVGARIRWPTRAVLASVGAAWPENGKSAGTNGADAPARPASDLDASKHEGVRDGG